MWADDAALDSPIPLLLYYYIIIILLFYSVQISLQNSTGLIKTFLMRDYRWPIIKSKATTNENLVPTSVK